MYDNTDSAIPLGLTRNAGSWEVWMVDAVSLTTRKIYETGSSAALLSYLAGDMRNIRLMTLEQLRMELQGMRDYRAVMHT